MPTKIDDTKHQNSTKPFEIILDDLDFTFTPLNMAKAVNMWNNGATNNEIADIIRPKGNRQTAMDETTMLLIHLRRKNRIDKRTNQVDLDECI